MKNVVYSHLGTILDNRGTSSRRWNQWRPNIGLCQQKDFHVDRLHLMVQDTFTKKAEQVIQDIRQVSPETEIVTELYECGDPWNFEQVYSYLYDLTERQTFNLDTENYFVHLTTGTHTVQICLFLLTESRHFPAKLLQTAPPREGGDSCGSLAFIDLNLSAYDQIAQRFEIRQNKELSFLKSGIETRNKRFNSLIEQIERVASVSVDPILLMGPTGAGKTQLARNIFELRRNKLKLKGNFVEVNCATLRTDTAMSTLFGHVKGAFTGAAGARDGLLREADKGVLFLDEIGELGLDEQAMLLHAIEEKCFYPMGSDKKVSSDFQLICGTNRKLQKRIREGLFREDLFARINLWPFELPALTQRPEDLEPNIEYELKRFTQRTGKRISFSDPALKRFLEFGHSPKGVWKGNFRDLNAAVTRMGTLADGGRITLETAEEEIERLEKLWMDLDWGEEESVQKGKDDSANVEADAASSETSGTFWKKFTRKFPHLKEMDRFDQVQLLDVLAVCREAPTMAEAGRRLFAVSRCARKTTNDADRLRKYLMKFQLTWDSVKEEL